MKKIVMSLALSSIVLLANDARIINGTEVSPSDTKYSAMIGLLANDGFICGGTAIAPTWVVTAAHCVFDEEGNVQDPSVMSVLVDTYNNNDGSGRKIQAKRVIPNSGYAGDDNDIALIELSSPVSHYAAINKSDNLKGGELVTITGWGNTAIDDYIYPSKLMEVDVPVIDLATCNAPTSYNGALFDTQICAGYMSGENIKDSCQGDSGGPLWSKASDGSLILSGVVSYGGSDTQSCAAPNFPGIYTKVSSFVSWIEGYTGTLSGSTTTSTGGDTTTTTPTTSSSALTKSAVDALSSGEWHMIGTTGAVSDMSVFANVKVLLCYDNGSYKAYSPDSATSSELERLGYAKLTSMAANSGCWMKK